MMVLDNEFTVHFNLKKIRRLMKKYGLKCPIRQANPYRRMMKDTQESYFGHMKDELNCFTFRDVCNEIKDYIEYYNNYRYQWNLKKTTPVQ